MMSGWPFTQFKNGPSICHEATGRVEKSRPDCVCKTLRLAEIIVPFARAMWSAETVLDHGSLETTASIQAFPYQQL